MTFSFLFVLFLSWDDPLSLFPDPDIPPFEKFFRVSSVSVLGTRHNILLQFFFPFLSLEHNLLFILALGPRTRESKLSYKGDR